MDNGLIFPYPRNRAHGESVILTLLKPPFVTFGWRLVVDAGDLIW